MKKVNDDFLDMTDDMVYLYEGKPFTGIGYEIGYNSQIMSEITYQNGIQDGLARDWYESGELRSETYYKNNGLHGVSKKWYRNGRIESESLYDFGILVESKEWDEDGNIIKDYKIDKTDPRFEILEKYRKLYFN